MQSITKLANAAMRIYDKVCHSQILQENILYNNILKDQSIQGATTKYISLHYDRNVGGGAGSETMTLPHAGHQQYQQANIAMKYNWHSISITDVAIQAAKRSKEHLVNVMESEYNGAKNDMRRQISRQCYGVGTGVICRVNDASPDATMTFDTPMVGKYPTDYFSIGSGMMFSSADDAATSAVYQTVSAITGNYAMTMIGDPIASDDDYCYLAHIKASGVPTVSNVNGEMMGLKGLIDDGTYIATLQGVVRGTYIWFKSYVDSSASQRSLTEALMYDTYLKATEKGKPKYGLTHPDVFAAYGLSLTPDRRYTTDMKLKGGFTGLAFNDIMITSDRDCPYDELYFIDPSSLSVEELSPIGFLDEDGSILERNGNAWDATLRWYANIATNSPNKNAVLRNVIR